jgi:hypothetical protein
LEILENNNIVEVERKEYMSIPLTIQNKKIAIIEND